MDDNLSDNTFRDELTLNDRSRRSSNVVLSFWHKSFEDEDHHARYFAGPPMPTVFAVSADGLNLVQSQA
jgi:hypothetical protein